jgi:OFA family oxalate/formate antiporter-like MFS transporter
MSTKTADKGRMVTIAGTGINLALGILYTWSIFKVAIKQSIETGGAGAFNWNLASINDPYAVCCLVFACAMIIAGKCQDTLGPRITAFIGGLLVGLGFIVVSYSTAYMTWIIGFGFLVGTGIAFGYSSATPAALKWYPPSMTGKVAGIVVAGFGLASVYIAPLAKYLLSTYGMQTSMLFFGVAFLIVMSILSMFLVNPPAGYVPKGVVVKRQDSAGNTASQAMAEEVNATTSQMMKTPEFWTLWVLYFMSAGAGLMVIGSAAGMAKSSLGESAFIAVALIAIGNAGGRVVAGVLSDKIGRIKTLGGMFVFQAILMFAAIPIIGTGATSALLLVLLATFIGFNYGANLTLFPSFTKDYWGMKNFGVNYGVIFTAWGAGGFVMSKTSQALAVSTGSYTAPFLIAGILLSVGVFFTFQLSRKSTLEKANLIEHDVPTSEEKHCELAHISPLIPDNEDNCDRSRVAP